MRLAKTNESGVRIKCRRARMSPICRALLPGGIVTSTVGAFLSEDTGASIWMVYRMPATMVSAVTKSRTSSVALRRTRRGVLVRVDGMNFKYGRATEVAATSSQNRPSPVKI